MLRVRHGVARLSSTSHRQHAHSYGCPIALQPIRRAAAQEETNNTTKRGDRPYTTIADTHRLNCVPSFPFSSLLLSTGTSSTLPLSHPPPRRSFSSVPSSQDRSNSHNYRTKHMWARKAPLNTAEQPEDPPMTPQSDINDWRDSFIWRGEEFQRLIQTIYRAEKDRTGGDPSQESPYPAGTCTRRLQRAMCHSLDHFRDLWNHTRTVQAMHRANQQKKKVGNVKEVDPNLIPMIDPTTMINLLIAVSYICPWNVVAPPDAQSTFPPNLYTTLDPNVTPPVQEPDYTPFFQEYPRLHAMIPYFPSLLRDIRKALIEYLPQVTTHMKLLRQTEGDIRLLFQNDSTQTSPSSSSSSSPLVGDQLPLSPSDFTLSHLLTLRPGRPKQGPPIPFLSAKTNTMPFRPTVHYGHLYAKMCFYAIRMAARLHDVELAYLAMRAQRSITNILLCENQHLEYLLGTWKEDAKLDSKASHLPMGGEANLRIPHTDVPFMAVKQLLFEATRQKNMYLQCMNDSLRLLQTDCMSLPPSPPESFDSHNSANAIISGRSSLCLKWCSRRLHEFWKDVETFELPLQMRHYTMLASTISSVQFEFLREQDVLKLKALSGRLHPSQRYSTPHGQTLSSRETSTHLPDYPIPYERVPIVDGAGQFGLHEHWQIKVLQRFPQRSSPLGVGLEESERIKRCRGHKVQILVDSLTDIMLAARDRLESQLRSSLEGRAGISLEDRHLNRTVGYTLKRLVDEVEAFRHPECASTMMTFHTTTMMNQNEEEYETSHQQRHQQRTSSQSHAGDDYDENDSDAVEYRAVGRSSAQSRKSELTSSSSSTTATTSDAHNSKQILRFLKPFFLSCLRSGEPSQALSALQFFMQCSLLPPFGFMRITLDILREEMKSTQLDESLKDDLRTKLPDFGKLKDLIRWTNMVQTNWPLHNDIFVFLIQTWSSIAIWVCRAQKLRSHAFELEANQVELDVDELFDDVDGVGGVAGGGELLESNDVPDLPTFPPELLSKPWTNEELQLLQRTAETALENVIDIGFGSTFYYRSDVRLSPTSRAKPWMIAAVQARLKSFLPQTHPPHQRHQHQHRSGGSDDNKQLEPYVQQDLEQILQHPLLKSSPNFDPTLLLNVDACRRWLFQHQTSIEPNWNISGWIDRAFRIIQISSERLLLELEDGLELFDSIQKLLARHIDLREEVFLHAMTRLQQDWQRAIEEEAMATSVVGGTTNKHANTRASTRYVSSVAWILLTMLDTGLAVPMSRIEWAAERLAESETLAAHFYLHAIRQRLTTNRVIPSISVYNSFLRAECTKPALRENLALRPTEATRPPASFLWESGIETGTIDTAMIDQHVESHLSSSHKPRKDGRAHLENVLERVTRQWNDALEQSGLVSQTANGTNVNVFGTTSTSTTTVGVVGSGVGMVDSTSIVMPALLAAAPSTGSTPTVGSILPPSTLSTTPTPPTSGTIYPYSSSSLSHTPSKNVRGSPFSSWLHSVLTLNLETILSTIDLMRSNGLKPNLRTFTIALEACVQLVDGKNSSLAASKGGSVLSALTNNHYTSGTQAATANINKAVHYAMLLRSDLAAAGLHPDIGIANRLLKLFLKSGKHGWVQEMLSENPSSTIGFTFLAGGPRRVVQTWEEDTTAASSSSSASSPLVTSIISLDSPISLSEELKLLKHVETRLQVEQPEYVIGFEDTREEWTDQEQLQRMKRWTTKHTQGLPIYVRPDRTTLQILDSIGKPFATSTTSSNNHTSTLQMHDSILGSYTYPEFLRTFHRQLQQRRTLEKSIHELEFVWEKRDIAAYVDVDEEEEEHYQDDEDGGDIAIDVENGIDGVEHDHGHSHPPPRSSSPPPKRTWKKQRYEELTPTPPTPPTPMPAAHNSTAPSTRISTRGEEMKNKVCTWYLAGRCKFGASCIYKHSPPGIRQRHERIKHKNNNSDTTTTTSTH